MDKLCKTLNPQLNVIDTICVNWFHHAIEHCMDVLLHEKNSGIWWSITNYFFPDTTIYMDDSNVTISIHPSHLIYDECRTLFNDAFRDYVIRRPRYAKEAQLTNILWHMIFIIISLGGLYYLLLIITYIYNKCKKTNVIMVKPMKHLNRMKATTHLQTGKNALINNTLHLAQCQLKRLRAQYILEKEDLMAPDGSPILALRVNSKEDIFNKLITNNKQSPGRLYQSQAEHFIKNITEFNNKNATITKALNFLDKFPYKLRVLLLIEDDTVYEEEISPFPNVDLHLDLYSDKSITNRRKQKNSLKSIMRMEKPKKKDYMARRSYTNVTSRKSVLQLLRSPSAISDENRSPVSSACHSYSCVSTTPRSYTSDTSAVHYYSTGSLTSHSYSSDSSTVHFYSTGSVTSRSYPPMSSTSRNHLSISSARSYPPIAHSPRSHLPIFAINKKTSVKHKID